MDLKQIRAEAEKEVAEEKFRASVEAEKEKIRQRKNRPWFRRLFPWRFAIYDSRQVNPSEVRFHKGLVKLNKQYFDEICRLDLVIKELKGKVRIYENRYWQD